MIKLLLEVKGKIKKVWRGLYINFFVFPLTIPFRCDAKKCCNIKYQIFFVYLMSKIVASLWVFCVPIIQKEVTEFEKFVANILFENYTAERQRFTKCYQPLTTIRRERCKS